MTVVLLLALAKFRVCETVMSRFDAGSSIVSVSERRPAEWLLMWFVAFLRMSTVESSPLFTAVGPCD